jgi:peptide/nickel transport system ATP-binding protein
MNTLLEIKKLDIILKKQASTIKLVDNVNLKVNKGETFGIVGESGCGKSVTALSIMRLLTYPLNILNGEILFEGKGDLLKLNRKEMQKTRGKDISMIFQEPMVALDPLFNIEKQITEVLRIHTDYSYEKMRRLALEMLERVKIPRAESILKEYPHQLSGGMLQRIMIAIALICNPKLLIADEPTTALDVTIQAQILELMNDLKSTYDTSVIMITHDLGVVAETCDRVAVFYGGQVVEQADVVALFQEPLHPYTNGLLKSVTSIGERGKALYSISGMVPNADQMPKGCRFSDRCSERMDICLKSAPEIREVKEGHLCRCWLYNKEA